MSLPEKPLTREEANRMATLAWSAYAALLRIEADNPELRENPFWAPLKETAHARFRGYYESEALK